MDVSLWDGACIGCGLVSFPDPPGNETSCGCGSSIMSVYVQYPPGSKKDIKISQHAGRHARRVLADCLYKSGHTIPQMMQPLMICAVSLLLLHKVDVVLYT